MSDVMWKFKPRVKAEKFTVYKPDSQGRIVFQSDKSIGFVVPVTGKGLLYLGGTKIPGRTDKWPTPAYFVHIDYGTPTHFPQEFVDAVIAAAPKSGDLIGSSPVCGMVQWA